MSINKNSKMDVEDLDDFVEVAQTVNALVLSVAPKYKHIGVESALTTTQACVTVKARELPEDDSEHARAPVDIVVALDVSGSMRGNKLKLCKLTLKMLLRTLNSKDKFGLVSYASDARVDIPVQSMSPKNKENSLKAIEGLTDRGCTNISAAIGLASQEIKTIMNPNEVQTIFLLTDGLANEGICDDDGLVELTRNCLTAKNKLTVPDAKYEASPITMHTFGYGSDHNANLLQQISEATHGGSYYFVESDSAVGSAFGDALGGVLSVVAQNVVITIKSCENNQISKVFHDRSILREDGSYTVDMGDFYSEETRDCLFEFCLIIPSEGGVSNNPMPHAYISMAYTDTIQKIPIVTNGTPIVCSINRPSGGEISTPDHYIKTQWLRITAVEEMKVAETLARERNYEGARKRMSEWKTMAKQECKEDNTLTRDPTVNQLFEDMNMCEDEFECDNTYRKKGAQSIHVRIQSHHNQRCAESSASNSSAYRTATKAKFSNKFSG
mmetsp:Transcript_42093/g.49180  ORF Transcript_42093/g.49180 Transcript_42093/m.49180 type:complete len:498 (+) Transcript_42093:49-1542(+)|eukprot:CAMPEP_0194356180 /NCGR_PEP_ID=MMETSP0174-20130528/3920_1 /TAXON_ID=216777 /ORGANISM="Proboscia alata, Strain PI-D3" /LENGTH=497 /DNA_ID=CAMNT_0039125697 /DNA_START=54 /DNA_END=1547 /DNA_ORIENTATION=-